MWASVLICAALAALLALAVWGIVRRRKKMRGKCEGCAGFCGSCRYDGCSGTDCGGSCRYDGCSGSDCGGSGGTDCGSTDSEDTQK